MQLSAGRNLLGWDSYAISRIEYPAIGDVRGKGLMIATEFSHSDGSPDPETASRVLRGCLDRQLLLLTCGTYKNVIRWIPPLVVSEEQISRGSYNDLKRH